MPTHFKTRPHPLGVAISILTGSLLGSGMAVAEELDDNDKLHRVEVTGSNIKRIASETASPLQIITRAEINQSGATTVHQILENMTSSTGALSDISGGNSFAGGASGISLRKLGKSSTLILLNGRRIAAYGLADGAKENFTNVDAIPADIIERIEILKDGASAIYGSDAVAGVINIITKKKFQGAALHASAQTSPGNSKLNKERSASLTLGTGAIESDGYNAFAHIEMFQRDPYFAKDVMDKVAPWYKKYINPNFGVRSTYSYPGNFIGKNPSTGESINMPVSSCPADKINDNLCTYDQWADLGYMPKSDRLTMLMAGRLSIAENLSGFSELSYANTQTTYFNPPAILDPGDFSTWYDARNKTVKTFTDPATISASNPINPYGYAVPLRYRFADDVSMFKKTVNAEQYRLLLGLEGRYGEWDWESAIGHMSSKSEQINVGAKHAENYLHAINSGEYQFGAVNDPNLLKKMFPHIGLRGEMSTTFLDAKATRELFRLDGGALAIAIGAEFRHEKFTMVSSENALNAEVVNFGSTQIDGSRNIATAFLEINAPLTKKLELNAALRADKSNRVALNLTPKLGVRYELSRQIMLRGTIANGFRAPNLAESGNGSLSGFHSNVEDPKRCETAINQYNILITGNAIDRARALDARDSGCAVAVGALTVSNPDLQPEKSRSYTLGLVLEPTKNISIALDYFQIERRNEIHHTTIQQALANEDYQNGIIERLNAPTEKEILLTERVKELAPNASGVNFSANSIAAFKNGYENMHQSRVSGIDIDINSRWDWGNFGRFQAGLEATHNLDYRLWDSNDNTYTENLIGNFGNYRNAAVAKFSLERNQWSGSVRINYASSTQLITDKYDKVNTIAGCAKKGIPASDCRLADDVTVDLSLSYRAAKNTTLSMAVQNAFDSDSQINPRAGNAPLRMRYFKFSVEHQF